MEHAILIHNLDEYAKIPDDYSRIYFGNEFCPHLLFRLDQIQQIVKLCQNEGKDLTLVTPYVTDSTLDKLGTILEFLESEKVRCEIVVNDWGLLYYLNQNFSGQFELVLGRLLNKMKKGPVIMNFLDKVTSGTKKVLQSTSTNLRPIWLVLENMGIKRVEFENVLQGHQFESGYPFERSLIYPYVFLSTSRRCVSEFAFQERNFYDLQQCSRSCKEHTTYLYNQIMGKDLILQGNTYYYENQKLPEDLQPYSRLVWQQLTID